jgi:hypothetical protein
MQALEAVGSVDDTEFFSRVAAASTNNLIDVVIEVEQDLPFAPCAHALPIYARIPDVAAEETVLRAARRNLAHIYENAASSLNHLRQTVDGRAYLALPPIALEVLDRADTITDIPEVLLETRKRYTAVRTHFKEVEETLMSPRVSLQDKLKAEMRFNEATRRIVEATQCNDATVLGALGKGAMEAIKSDLKLPGQASATIGLSAAKLLEHIKDLAQLAHVRYRLRPLYSTIHRYLAVSAADMQRVIKKHFHHTVTAADRELARSYSSRVEKLLRSMSIAATGVHTDGT